LLLPLACGILSASDFDETSSLNSRPSLFVQNLPGGCQLPPAGDLLARRILAEYGAVFAARGGAVPPPVVIFPDEASVAEWQKKVSSQRAEIGGIVVELQRPALSALLAAREEARRTGRDITPRGADSARRSYEDTVRLWRSRVEPGLEHWVNLGRLDPSEAGRIRALSPREQVPEILALEERGLYFSTDRKKSILFSVAPPGASQHLSMLAFDVKEHESRAVRRILARHGWFQTISTDLPHFTFLGVAEKDLPELGLKRKRAAGRVFWLPDLGLD
jgi:hypothetical protein